MVCIGTKHCKKCPLHSVPFFHSLRRPNSKLQNLTYSQRSTNVIKVSTHFYDPLADDLRDACCPFVLPPLLRCNSFAYVGLHTPQLVFFRRSSLLSHYLLSHLCFFSLSDSAHLTLLAFDGHCRTYDTFS